MGAAVFIMETLMVFVFAFKEIWTQNAMHRVIYKFSVLIAANLRTRKFSNWNICFLVAEVLFDSLSREIKPYNLGKTSLERVILLVTSIMGCSEIL